jgi:hypothetical protein
VHSLFERYGESYSAASQSFKDTLQLPQLPPKYLKAMTNHTNEVFLATRRAQLQFYIDSLLNMASAHGAVVRMSPDLFAFVGFSFLAAANTQI